MIIVMIHNNYLCLFCRYLSTTYISLKSCHTKAMHDFLVPKKQTSIKHYGTNRYYFCNKLSQKYIRNNDLQKSPFISKCIGTYSIRRHFYYL
jgi:hypothetical protein